MKCEYCENNLLFSHYENQKEIAVYDCTECPILTSFYVYCDSPAIVKISFMFEKNGHSYIWTNNYITNSSYIVNVSRHIDFSALKDNLGIIVEFPQIMKINPSNVLQKFSFCMCYL
jgi:hypothetical protein